MHLRCYLSIVVFLGYKVTKLILYYLYDRDDFTLETMFRRPHYWWTIPAVIFAAFSLSFYLFVYFYIPEQCDTDYYLFAFILDFFGVQMWKSLVENVHLEGYDYVTPTFLEEEKALTEKFPHYAEWLEQHKAKWQKDIEIEERWRARCDHFRDKCLDSFESFLKKLFFRKK